MCELVNGIGVGDKIVNGYLRDGRIHQPNAVCAAAVACHVTHGCRYRDGAVGQSAEIRSRYVHRPGPVTLDGGLIVLAVQRNGNRLSRLSIAAAA